MATNASIGWGTLFATGNGAVPEIFTTLGEVTAITPPAMSRDTVDVSHEQSSEAWREFIPGMKDGGEVSLEINFVPGSADAAALKAEFDSQTAKNRRITFPDGSTFTFAGILTGFEPDAPIDDKMSASLTYKVTGKPLLNGL